MIIQKLGKDSAFFFFFFFFSLSNVPVDNIAPHSEAAGGSKILLWFSISSYLLCLTLRKQGPSMVLVTRQEVEMKESLYLELGWYFTLT